MKISEIKDDEVKERAVELAITSEAREWRKSNGYNFEPKNAEDLMLDEAFSWSNCTEGYDYWKNILHEHEFGEENISLRRFKPVSKDDDQVNPKHYKENLFGQELQYVMIDFFGKEKYKVFCQLNAFKYRMRAGNKSDKVEQDIQKAMWYEDKIKSL